MQSLEHTGETLVGKLTTPRAMSAIAVVVFAATILPLAGGLPKPYEVREFRAAFAAFLDGETSSPSTEPAVYPGAGRAAPAAPVAEPRAPARVQRASLAIDGADELAKLDVESTETSGLTNLNAVEVTETFEEPVEACDTECEAEQEEWFREEEYGPLEEDAAF